MRNYDWVICENRMRNGHAKLGELRQCKTTNNVNEQRTERMKDPNTLN